MSRYNEDHARLFTGVVPPIAIAPVAVKARAVTLVRHADDRARFGVDTIAMADLEPAIGDRFECEIEWRDGLAVTAVEVYAVWPAGFVDVRGLGVAIDDKPRCVRLRKYT